MQSYQEKLPEALKEILCDYLLVAWEKGWFANYSSNHFLIKALYGEIDTFTGYENMLQISSGPLQHDLTTVRMSFYQSLSFSLKLLEEFFSEKDAKAFVVEKLSGGKTNYDEAQFLRALSELTVIKWFCLYSRGSYINEMIYEPHLNNGRNPEARFIRDDVIIDVEVKTPGFIPIENTKPKITPIIPLNKIGREALTKKCIANDIELRLPDINKLKQHLNDAASKFVTPISNKHFNVVYLNWTYCDYPKYAFMEPYSLLMNDNGVLRNKYIGLALGLNEDVYTKLTAVVVYNENIEGYVNQDLRHIWSHRTFALVVNPYIDCDISALESTLQMEQSKNVYPIPKALFDYYAKDGVTQKDLKKFLDLMQEYEREIEIYALANGGANRPQLLIT